VGGDALEQGARRRLAALGLGRRCGHLLRGRWRPREGRTLGYRRGKNERPRIHTRVGKFGGHSSERRAEGIRGGRGRKTQEAAWRGLRGGGGGGGGGLRGFGLAARAEHSSQPPPLRLPLDSNDVDGPGKMGPFLFMSEARGVGWQRLGPDSWPIDCVSPAPRPSIGSAGFRYRETRGVKAGQRGRVQTPEGNRPGIVPSAIR